MRISNSRAFRQWGNRRNPLLSGALMLPEQVAKLVTPLHMAVELLPLGLFAKEHADHVAKVVSLIAADSAGKNNGVWRIADRAGQVLLSMHKRVKDGANWGATVDERRILRETILAMDKYMRTWTNIPFMIAAGTVNELNASALAAGGQFLDRVEIRENRS